MIVYFLWSPLQFIPDFSRLLSVGMVNGKGPYWRVALNNVFFRSDAVLCKSKSMKSIKHPVGPAEREFLY